MLCSRVDAREAHEFRSRRGERWDNRLFDLEKEKKKKEGHDSRSFDGNGEKVNDAFWGVVENFSPVILITGILHQSPRGLSWHA